MNSIFYKILNIIAIIIILLFLSISLKAQDSVQLKSYSDDWVATDGMGMALYIFSLVTFQVEVTNQ